MKTFDRLLKTLSKTAGRDRLPATLQFISHVTLAYPKTYHGELELIKRLRSHPVADVNVRAKKLSLIKQNVKDDYYVWETVKELPIGQMNSKDTSTHSQKTKR